jgi:hypothetical protein
MNRTLLCVTLSCCLASWTVADGKVRQVLKGEQIVTITNIKSGHCMGVDRASMDNGALVKQFKCDGRPNQRWRVQNFGTYNKLVNVKSRKCMGVDGASKKHGANIGQYNCGHAPNQAWILFSDGPNSPPLQGTLGNVKSERCIGVNEASRDHGAQLRQFKCDYIAPNQEWRLRPVNVAAQLGPGNLGQAQN